MNVIQTVWLVTLTCSAVLFSAVLGRFEESGLSEVSDREEGLLEGIGESDWCRSEWLDTAAHSHRCTQTRRGKERRADMSRQGEDLAAWEQVNQ